MLADEPVKVPRGLVAVLFGGTLVAAFDIALVGPTLRAIGEAFGLSERATSWVLTAFVLANLTGQPFTSWLGDVYARKSVFLGSLGVFVLGTLGVVFAPSFGMLIAGRVVQGLGASGLFPMASAVVGDAFPVAKRGRVLGLLGAVFGVAFLVGPILAGVLVPHGWRWVFVATLPLAALVFVAALRVLPRLSPAERRPLDAVGTLLLAASLLTLALAANRVRMGETGEATLWLPLVLLFGTAVLAALFVWQERRTPHPLLRPALFARRQVKLAALFCVGAGLSEALFVFLPAYAQEAFGVDRSAAAYMLLPLVVTLTFGAPAAGRLLDTYGSRAMLRLSALLLSAGLAVVAFLPVRVAVYFSGTVLIGLGLSGMLGSSLSYILLNESLKTERAVAQSVVTVFLGAGQIAGAALIGALVASASGVDGFRQAFTVVLAVALVLVAASFALKRRADERANGQS